MPHDPDVTHVGICGCDTPNPDREETARLRAALDDELETVSMQKDLLWGQLQESRETVARLRAELDVHQRTYMEMSAEWQAHSDRQRNRIAALEARVGLLQAAIETFFDDMEDDDE